MIFVQISFVLLGYYQNFTPPKTNMRMENQPFEDVSLIEDGDFPAFQADLEKVKWDAKNRQDGMEFSYGWDGAGRPLKMKGLEDKLPLNWHC